MATRPLAKGTCGKWLVGSTHPTQGRQAAQGSSSRLVCRARARAVHARFLLRSTKHERTRGLSEAASMERPDIFEKAQML